MRLSFLAFLMILLFACQTKKETDANSPQIPTLQLAQIDTFVVNSSVRALEVVDDQTIWWAGSEGRYGFSTDGGLNWTIDSIQWDTIRPHFRSIAVTKEATFLLSIASPALLFRSADQGENWELVYKEENPAAFYDAMAFWDDKEGIAMGDPTDGCLSVLITKDGGRTWDKVDCESLPAAEEGEAAFAASNSNIALTEKQVWLVSGGKRARVFHSPDRGQSWTAYDTPIAEGGPMTGIFSIDFYDDKQGIVFGGDWNAKERNVENKALSMDGGQTWQPLLDGAGPGYQSCVQFIPASDGKGILSCGIPGINYSPDGGQNWTELSTDSWYTLRFGSSWKTVWLAGNGKVGKITWVE